MARVDPADLIFATKNSHKVAEAESIARDFGISLVHLDLASVEIQSADINALVEQKARDAYLRVLRPLFVEHTSLHIDYLGGLPGGFTSIFMDSVGEERMCQAYGSGSRCAAHARTTIGYCDGRTVRTFSGRLDGRVVARPRGGDGAWESFGFNRIFAPAGYSKTFAELGESVKNSLSMRRTALIELFTFVGGAAV